MSNNLLVSYVYSSIPDTLSEENIGEYATTIIESLERSGLISDILTHKQECPFGGEPTIVKYTNKDNLKILFRFSSKEDRKTAGNIEKYIFQFNITFNIETHSNVRMLYVEMLSENYSYSLDGISNSLEVLKHKLRKKLRESGCSKCYCIVDNQSAYYAAELYKYVHGTENALRAYIYKIFSTFFGSDWWEKIASPKLIQNKQSRIAITKNTVGRYGDVELYIHSLDVLDLIDLAKVKRYTWNPIKCDQIEQFINDYSKITESGKQFNIKEQKMIMDLLTNQCTTQKDMWDLCFANYIDDKFEEKYKYFEKRRNQIAHNKLVDFNDVQYIKRLCTYINEQVEIANTSFANDNISQEMQQYIDFIENLSDQSEDEFDPHEHEHYIAQEESGVRVLDNESIIELFDNIVFNIFIEIEDDLSTRESITVINKISSEKFFVLEDSVNKKNINLTIDYNVDPTQGATSKIIISESENTFDNLIIQYINGEYYKHSDGHYLPERQDEIVGTKEVTTKIYEIIENILPDLKEVADLYKHLSAMGKEDSIVNEYVSCEYCGEEYICINPEYAPKGTCLNCGENNKIETCFNCGQFINRVDGYMESTEEDIIYCEHCYHKLFGPD